MIEEFIPGRELTVGVLGDLALPILEIIPKSGFYDFNDKYPFLNPQGGGGAQHVCPAEIPDDLTSKIQDLALLACRSLGLKVYSRVDVMLSEQNEPFVLEINTIPGMTETSLLPDAAAVAGITYPQLCSAHHRTFTRGEARQKMRAKAEQESAAHRQSAALYFAPAPAAASCSTSRSGRAARPIIATAASSSSLSKIALVLAVCAGPLLRRAHGLEPLLFRQSRTTA